VRDKKGLGRAGGQEGQTAGSRRRGSVLPVAAMPTKPDFVAPGDLAVTNSRARTKAFWLAGETGCHPIAD
jgi:hypothetical protein